MFKSAVDSQKLETFLEINDLINSSYFDLNGLFTRILESATRLTDGEASSLLLLIPETQGLQFIVALGAKGEEVKSFVLKKGEGIAGWVAENNTPLIVHDVEKDSRFFSDISKNVGFATKSILAVPLRVKGRCVGVVEMINKKNNSYFTAEDMTWLEVFSNQAGLALQNAQSFQAMREEIQTLKDVLGHQRGPSILTKNAQMLNVLELCRKYALTDSSVLITGESGTGKELIAEYIHTNSPRAQGPLVRVNCAALPEALMESELFGHVKGAFTDAYQDKVGRFEMAQGGTLFLDEIGEISPLLQAKLLRVLQSKTMERVGGNETISLDVRLVVATNRDLKAEVDEGRFRRDLFYRLHVLPIHLPPLRDRPEDIPLLAGFFLKEKAQRFEKDVKQFDLSAIERMLQYEWPGNVRQLQNTIERAVVLCGGSTISINDIGLEFDSASSSREMDLKEAVQEFKNRYILECLERFQGNQTKTAKYLGIQRTYLSKLLREMEIETDYEFDKE